MISGLYQESVEKNKVIRYNSVDRYFAIKVKKTKIRSKN